VGAYGHTLWLLADGRVFAAGYNSYGQVGNGTTADQTAGPAHVETLHDVVDVWAGGGRYASSFASCAGGDFYAWGYNGYGQLGLGNNSSRTLPALHTLRDIAAVAIGTHHNLDYASNHSALLDGQGRAYAAGYNGSGQCGVGHHDEAVTTHQRMHLPQGVQGNIVQIQTMGYYSEQGTALLDHDGHVWACGYNGGHMLCATPTTASSMSIPQRVVF
jgi:alpha-tubulin suppressor-like RCC1 family protein